MSYSRYQVHCDNENFEEALQSLVGLSVVAAKEVTPKDSWGNYDDPELHMELSDGRVFKVKPNIGGCCCGSGDYYVLSFAKTTNVITNVEFVGSPESSVERTFRVFVLCDGLPNKEELFVVSGDDGNGWYGTGFWVELTEKDD